MTDQSRSGKYENVRSFLDGLQYTHLCHKHGWMVDIYPAQFYATGTLIHKPGEFGLYITPMREIVSVWSKGGGKLPEMLRLASQAGGGWLSVFDGGLVQLYEAAGAVTFARAVFDANRAPMRWDRRLHGTPDVVQMQVAGLVPGYERPLSRT